MIEIKHKTTGQVLYTHQGDSLSHADLFGADLGCANLSGVNLSYANLSYANLSYANLSYANLSFADLSFAHMYNADLGCANLSGVNLSYASLSYANLHNANLHGANLQVIQSGRYTAYVTSSNTRIGCKIFSNAKWRALDDSQIANLAPDALVWWTANKAIIFAAMDSLSAQFPG